MKNKKNIIIISIIAALIIIAVVLFFVLKPTKITISFDTDGGTKVDAIEIKKGKSVKLPTTSKEEYIFDGWYMGNTKVSNENTYKESTELKAHWIKEDAKTFIVTFDSNGGTKVEPITLEEGQKLTLPNNPKKDGYKFKGWYDKNETPILNDALLTCEDITLTAKWEKEVKEETKKEETKKEVTKKEVTYSCEEGWVLNNDKCEYTYRNSAKFSCPSGSFEVNGKCVLINGSNRVTANKTCKSNTYPIDNKGHTKTTDGILITIPNAYSYCVYGEVTQSDEQASQTTCTSRGHAWANGKCYYSKTGPGENMESSCNSGYTYISDPNSYQGVNGLNGGCFKETAKVGSCQSGYYLSGSYCFRKEVKAATVK